jgi:site-specific DNA-methyltransferase (adenine-specific)
MVSRYEKEEKKMTMRGRMIQTMDFKDNTIYVSDCLSLLRYWYHKQRLSKLIDLIYIDPPFNSKKDYNIIIQPHDIQLQEKAFEDTWSLVKYSDCLEEIRKMGNINLYLFLEGLKTSNLTHAHVAYLANMGIRIIYMREMLKDTGSFYYHCDPTMSHYIKIMLDYVFGINNFRNEIVWCYVAPGQSSKNFLKKHDIIFRYTKTDNYIFNIDDVRIPYNEKTSIINSGKKFNKSWKDGEEYKMNPLGKLPEDWWTDIGQAYRSSKEYLRYPTQKPEALSERIILASTNENDLVADFFMGGGTSLSVAKKNNRRFIGSDINLRAVQWTSARLSRIKKPPIHFLSGIPSSSKQLQAYLKSFNPSKGGFALEDLVIKIYLSTLTVERYNFEIISKIKNNVGYDGEFVWNFREKARRGLVQVTSSHNYQHFGSFCNILKQEKADVGIYVTFKKNVTKNMNIQAANSKKLGNFPSIQILSIEDLIDNKKLFDMALDIV